MTGVFCFNCLRLPLSDAIRSPAGAETLLTRIPGEKVAGKESSYLFREVAFPRQRRRYLSNKGLVVPLRYRLSYLWGKIRASSMSARAF